LATLMQSFAITCLVTIIWMIAGYSLAFSKGTSSLIGNLDLAFLNHLTVGAINGTIPDTVFVVFQATFAIITAALITGAVAERMKFSALLWFIGLWSVIVYSPVTFWVWGGGFLGAAGVLDFAGGTVVHINSGVAALVAAIMVGKRKGYGTDNLAPHNVALTMIGASLLWVGWFGFNAGSAVGANGTAGMAMAVTQIAAAAAGLSWMTVEWFHHKKPTLLGIVSGSIGGLVAITPASGFVDPMGGLIIGLAAGVVCYWGAAILKPMLGYDDALDVFAVHGLGGITGAILTGVFAVQAIGGSAGALEGNAGQILIQLQGIVATILWSGAASAFILFGIDKVIGLRVDADAEAEGLDINQHGEMLH
ncbi:MAG TPA: ammonium transporter, partial [Rhodospirillales bacterium]|nr:ammonium transporter [Rhodospirillales bacterium]